MLPGWQWYGTDKGDGRALALYRRHYSAQRQDGRQFAPPGETMVLLTADCSALWVWSRAQPGLRADGQGGVCCTVFRKERAGLASELIREADELADRRWPGERHFTYVDPRKVRTHRPGYCFRKAGWLCVGESRGGLLIFARAGR